MQLNRAVQKLFTLGVTLGLVALLASGCLTAGNSFTVKEDGSIDVNMVMLFNRETLDALGSMFGEAVTPEDFTTEIEDQFTSDLPIDESRVDIKEIDDERGVGINVTLHFEDYEEMKEAMSQGDSGDGDDIVADVEITQDGSKWTFIGTAETQTPWLRKGE